MRAIAELVCMRLRVTMHNNCCRTGRNIHALDPYRMPSAAALERGSEAARLIVESHRKQNGGAFPETVAVNLWGLDAIKTKGESVAIVLHLVGARPVREGALGRGLKDLAESTR